MGEINKALKEYSPILIRSSNLKLVGTSKVEGNGIAIFHVPAANDKVFYAFTVFEKNDKLSASYQTKVWHDVLPLSSLPDNIFLEFSNEGEKLNINTVKDSKEITKRFNETKGTYGWYLTSGTTRASGEEAKQLGFIEMGFSERYKYARLTREQFVNIEQAYVEAIKPIEEKGKRLLINTEDDRDAFIRKYQGKPDTARVVNAMEQEHQYQRNLNASVQEIVDLVKKEPDYFSNVRMIHDWVADVFSYDMDLLKWMDTHGQAKFSLEQIESMKRGVCFEYSILFWYLMDSAGIDAYLILDHSAPEFHHAYNMVVINGTGYIVDTTWDSVNKYEGGKFTQRGRSKRL
jgi:hypothetical protein